MRIQSLSLTLAASLSLFACGPRNQDRLDDNELATAAGGTSTEPDTRCTGQAAQDEVKRQLFARAAEIRGSNAADYASIASFAVIDLDRAAPDATAAASQMIECRAHATLRLPSGLRVAGGRTALGGDIGYSIAPGAGGAVTLGQSDSIATPLATLSQSRAAPPAAEPSPDPAIAADPLAPVEPLPQPLPEPRQPAPVEVDDVARPSFDCRRARTPGENAVCDSPTLAALDRAMAAQYRGAVANGDPDERRLLAQTRDRFLIFRDRCGSDSCIATAYRGRMREIDDIMAGRWQSAR